jgi:hypothetical protein
MCWTYHCRIDCAGIGLSDYIVSGRRASTQCFFSKLHGDVWPRVGILGMCGYRQARHFFLYTSCERRLIRTTFCTCIYDCLVVDQITQVASEWYIDSPILPLPPSILMVVCIPKVLGIKVAIIFLFRVRKFLMPFFFYVYPLDTNISHQENIYFFIFSEISSLFSTRLSIS